MFDVIERKGVWWSGGLAGNLRSLLAGGNNFSVDLKSSLRKLHCGL